MSKFGNNRFGNRNDFSRRSFSDRGGDREMFPAVCSSCGADCKVPFEPSGNKPVYCSDCFEKNNNRDNSNRFQDRGSQRPHFERRTESRPQHNEQLDAINRKLDQILSLLAASPIKTAKKKTVSSESNPKTEEILEKIKTTAKKTKTAKKK